MEAARAGGDRQELHEAIRENAMAAYAALARGEDEPARAACSPTTSAIVRYVDPAEVRSQLDPLGHVGDAPRARAPPRIAVQRISRHTIGAPCP